jgi:hypothetical protein
VTAAEFVSKLSPVDLERLITIFLFLADNSHTLRLRDGGFLRDGTDTKQFFIEVVEELAHRTTGRTISA